MSVISTLSMNEYLNSGMISYNELMAKFSRTGPKRILDFGCGSGYDLATFHRAGWECYGVEVRQDLVKRASEYGQVYLRQNPGEPLHWFADNSFDLILANCVFHHIATMDVSASLVEIARCLKLEGQLVIYEVVEDSSFIRLIRSVHPSFEGVPVRSRMYAHQWIAMFHAQRLQVVAAYDAIFWLMLWDHVIPKIVGSSSRGVDSRFHRFVATPPGQHHSGVARVLYILEKEQLGEQSG